MNTQIIKVYYGSDALPYKDKERTVHFPVSGSTFLGSSDTTKIRFYVDGYLADENALWISVSKRADGTQGSQFLTSGTDESGDKYREMTLSGWYTEKKGDLYISLKGYQGGSTGYWDEDTGMYVVQGVPVIRATGSIKLAINYAPVGEYPYYPDEMASFQDLVAQLGGKLNITSGIKVVSSTSSIIISNEEEGQLFYSKADKKLYQLVSGNLVVFFETYDKDTLDTKFSGKVDKLTTSGQYVYSHLGSTQSELPVSTPATGDTIAKRENDGRLKVATPTSNGDATTKEYVDSGLDLKADKSTTYTKTETDTLLSAKADKSDTYTKSQVDDAIASAVSSAYKYKGSVSTYEDLPTSGNEVGDVYNVEDTGDNYAWTGTAWDKLAGTVDLSDYALKSELTSGLATKQNVINSVNKLASDLVDDTNQTNKFVTTSEKSTWNAKQDELVSGTNIKTINGDSILGNGNLVIDLSDEYAKVDGNYASMTVGAADNLTPYSVNSGKESDTPFIGRTTGGSADVGALGQLKELRGNTINWKQLIANGNFENTTGWHTNSSYGTLSASSNKLIYRVVSPTSTLSNAQIYYDLPKPYGNSKKYLFKITIKPSFELKLKLSVDSDTITTFEANKKTTYACIITANSGTSGYLYLTQNTSSASVGDTIEFENCQFFEIEEIGTITDVVSFNRLYPKSFYQPNSGQLISCKIGKLVSIGMNQFDYSNPNNFIKVICGRDYIVENCNNGTIVEYDENQVELKTTSIDSVNYSISLNENTHYVKLTGYSQTTCLYVDWSSLGGRTGYEQYWKKEYSLPNIELRSVPDYTNGSVIYDVIYPNGIGRRRIGVVKLKELDWSLITGATNSFQVQLSTDYKAASSNSEKANISCNVYEVGRWADVYNRLDGVIGLNNSRYLGATDTNYTDATTFKNHFTDNDCLFVELAQEELIETSSFSENIEIDDMGTEWFENTDTPAPDVIVPQGNYIFYPVDYKAFIDSLGEREDIEYDATKIVSQEQLQNAIAQIPTGDFGFPIITAPSSTTLTADEVATISKGAVILGSSSNKFLNYEKIVFFPLGEVSFGENGGFALCVNNFVPEIRSYRINSQNVISINDATTKRIKLQSIAQINGKIIPDYPSNTGSWTLKCVNGTLTWVED